MLFGSASSSKSKKRVAVVGGGAAGMACAWSVSLSDKFDSVTVLESLESAGGVASTNTTADGRDRINDQVQGGAPSYRNNLLFFKQAAGAEPTDVRFKIAFGRGDSAWFVFCQPRHRSIAPSLHRSPPPCPRAR